MSTTPDSLEADARPGRKHSPDSSHLRAASSVTAGYASWGRGGAAQHGARMLGATPPALSLPPDCLMPSYMKMLIVRAGVEFGMYLKVEYTELAETLILGLKRRR